VQLGFKDNFIILMLFCSITASTSNPISLGGSTVASIPRGTLLEDGSGVVSDQSQQRFIDGMTSSDSYS